MKISQVGRCYEYSNYCSNIRAELAVNTTMSQLADHSQLSRLSDILLIVI